MGDKQVIVTGGSNGIGESISKKFLQKGFDTIVFDKNKPSYDVRNYEIDVRDHQEIKEAAKEIDEVDILINNAGVYRTTPTKNFEQSDFFEIFETNVKAYRMMYSEFLSHLKKSDDGNVVNLSSGLSKRPEPYSDLYCASKSAINSMSSSWAINYKNTGVRSNCVLPGPVKTEMLFNNFNESELKEYKEKQSMRRFIDKEEVSNVVFFIATNKSFNGAEVEVGGESSYNQYGE